MGWPFGLPYMGWMCTTWQRGRMDDEEQAAQGYLLRAPGGRGFTSPSSSPSASPSSRTLPLPQALPVLKLPIASPFPVHHGQEGREEVTRCCRHRLRPHSGEGRFDWTAKSNVPMKTLQLLEKEGQIASGQWRKPGDEIVPEPRDGERVVYVDHIKRGFSLPLHAFVRGLLYVYGLQVHDLLLNSMMQITCFMVLYECFLGVHPHWALWKRLFYMKSNTANGIVHHVGGFNIQSRPNIKYFDMKFIDSVQGWRRRWFYLKDESLQGQQYGLASFDPEATVTKRRSWRHEMSAKETAATEGLATKLATLLSNKSFKGTHLVSLFLRWRVQSLQARVTPMWEYSDPSDQTRIREEELSIDEFEARLRAVTALKSDVQLPAPCPVSPLGEGNHPKEVNCCRLCSLLSCAFCCYFSIFSVIGLF